MNGYEETDYQPILCHVSAYKGLGLYQAKLGMRQPVNSHSNRDKKKKEY